ncbi:hypothetical protein PAXRUDRAFT_822785 [Paxillus rubicundulus Ve08.2h10]|uniref:Uncharacterized protein n=1 Tax=Paxillus rubicundulus Ve08.2h10 TaxID=930991 RepID=A0A0D0ECI5_9AGAM|nr:hypothetical protein PAXRUDRAFT_822785 [Paxillus rubicundulus Ve08.2h10]
MHATVDQVTERLKYDLGLGKEAFRRCGCWIWGDSDLLGEREQCRGRCTDCEIFVGVVPTRTKG